MRVLLLKKDGLYLHFGTHLYDVASRPLSKTARKIYRHHQRQILDTLDRPGCPVLAIEPVVSFN